MQGACGSAVVATSGEFMMRIFAIDPGPEQSAFVVLDGGRVTDSDTLRNPEMLTMLRAWPTPRTTVLMVEQVASFGMPVGAEVFETVFWSGRFVQAWCGPWGRLKRHEIKTALCGNQRAKDAHIRQALIDRFGPGKNKAIGRKAAPGPLYGISGDEWSALAVAVTYSQSQLQRSAS